MVLLHARGEQAEDLVELWRHAPDVLLIAPRSSQPLAIHAACWDDAARGVDVALGQGSYPPPLVVAGFSQGGGLAIALAAKGVPAGVEGFIAMAPSVTWFDELIDAELQSPHASHGAILVGEGDPRLTETEALVDELRRGGATVHLEVVTNLGHAYPSDFDERLPELISRVIGNDRNPATT